MPVWQAYRTPGVPTKRLTRDVKADVLVVGMGISGAMMTEALAGEGMSVIAIDRRGPIKGSTAATTALVQFEIDQPLSLLSGKIGKDRAERAWRRSRLGAVQPESAHCRAGDPVRPRRTQFAVSRRQCARSRRASRGRRAAAGRGSARCLSVARRAEGTFRHRPRSGSAQRRQSGARPEEACRGPVSQGGGQRRALLCAGGGNRFCDGERQDHSRDQGLARRSPPEQSFWRQAMN